MSQPLLTRAATLVFLRAVTPHLVEKVRQCGVVDRAPTRKELFER